MDVQSSISRVIAWMLMTVLVFNPLISTAADLAVDASSGSTTQVTQAASGVPIVNIATPNAGGLSHNTFTDYNVNPQGLILNNATDKFIDTQLGGVILGNSNLGGQAATLILNEVTGSNPSQLKGYTEVAGQGAHVVVANPHGISCDGCGFVNTPRVSLSTGAPVIEQGQLRRFAVEGGQVVIGGAGLNAANVSQFDLITRAATLNAALYAERLNIILGRNEVDAATLAAVAKPDDSSEKPVLALDSSALGGMYAGAIRLVGTEQGVGVNMAGDMAASGGDISIDAKGELTLKRIVAAGELKVSAQQIAFAEKAHADAGVTLNSSGAVVIDKSLTSAADVSIKALSLTNQGTLGGAGSVKLEVPTLINQGGLIFSGENMVLAVDSFTNRLGDVYSLGSLDISANEHVDNRSGTLESTGHLRIGAKRISNQRDVLTTRQEKYAARITELPCSVIYGAGDCDGKQNHIWEVLERDRLVVSAASASSFITAGGNLSLMGEHLFNHASAISAAGDLSIQVNDLSNLGVQPGEYENTRVFRSKRTRDPQSWRKQAASFSALYWPSTDNPLGLTAALNHFIGRTETERLEFRKTTAIKTDDETYSAILQAGGKVDIATTSSFDNRVVKPSYAYVAGGNLISTELAGSAIATAISRNPQLTPDISQQPVLPGFSLPSGDNGLFRLNTDGTHAYLVETNPVFASLRGFISSDYFLNLIGYDLAQTQRRLGDGLYEQRLIQQAVIDRTGKRFLDGLTSNEAQFKYLMDNAIASKQALNLVPGVALSAAQVAALTHDIVWMQEQQIGGQKVLVPVLYLAQAKDRLAPSGALVQGREVALLSGNTLANSGTLRAGTDLKITAGNVQNSGLMQAEQAVSVLAADSIRNTLGGLLVGTDVSAIALAGDIVNERSVTRHESSKRGFERREMVVDSAAGMEASNQLVLSAGRDLINSGANLKAGGDAILSAGRNVLITSQQETDSKANSRGKKNTKQTSSTLQHGAEISVGANLTLEAGNDLAVSASQLTAGDDAFLYAGNQLTVLSAEDSDHYLYEKQKKGNWGRKETRRDERTHVRNVGSRIETGGDLTLVSEGDQLYQKASLHSGGNLTLDSGGAITFEAVKDLDQESHEQSKSDWAWNSAKGEGHIDETLRQSEIVAKGETILRAVDGVRIDIKQVNRETISQTISAMVAADPQLAWLKEAEKRGDVDWRQVQEIHDAWDYQSAGLGMGAALIIAIVVTVLTSGAASGAIGTMAGATAGSGSAMAAGLGATAAGFGNVAATAVATSVASTTAVSAINNKGNVGAIAKDVFSSEKLKGYLSAALIAGVGAKTDAWGTTSVAEGNLKVTDLAERAKAYAVNTALAGLLSESDSTKAWLTVAGSGALMEFYKYSAGREPDVKPGVDRADGAQFSPLEGDYVPRETVGSGFRDGKNIGSNWPSIESCSSWYSICHATPISNGLNTLPGFNAFATLHDTWMTRLETTKGGDMSLFENIGSMPPALIITYGALYDKYRPEIHHAKNTKPTTP